MTCTNLVDFGIQNRRFNPIQFIFYFRFQLENIFWQANLSAKKSLEALETSNANYSKSRGLYRGNGKNISRNTIKKA